MALLVNNVSISLITCHWLHLEDTSLLFSPSFPFLPFPSSPFSSITSYLLLFLSALFSSTVLSPRSGLVLLTCRWCGLEGWSWCKVTCLPITGVELRLGLTSPALGCFCSPQLMRIICWDAVEGCHKDLAQGVWENSRSVFHAQTLP